MVNKLRVAVDVGGTFTDMCVYNEASGEVRVFKAPSAPANPAEGIINVIDKSGINMSEVVLFAHGTTVGTNALITRSLPPSAMVTTKGFRDVIEIRRSTKPDLWDHYKDVAPPYIPRRHRLEVEERVDYAGNVLKPLNEAEAREVARILKRREIKAVAICFLNSYVNGVHEQRMKEILKEELPDAYICTSSEVLPEIFEHERFSTTVVNAVLGPVVGQYLNTLTARLSQKGYSGDVLVLHCGGGVMTAETVQRFAARIASSGIAAGAIAAAYTAKLCGYENAIGLDMGGTSCDISLMYQGNLRMTKEWYVEYGYPIMFPSIEIITIGAGGGTIAWIDEGGSLRNGPMSAGADPGPVCYQKGGTQPTNTDANLLLGRLSTNLLGGEMMVDRDAAERAIAELGGRFGLSSVQMADAILKVANANMCDALRLISIQKGYDPREFVLVAFGGAGPLHAAYLAKELSIPTVIIPPYPGIHSALGCLLVDVRHDVSKTYIRPAADARPDELEAEFQLLENEGLELLRREGTEDEAIELLRFMDMRYVGQWRSLTIPVGRPITQLDSALEAFHREHQREYAWSNTEQGVEIYGLRVVAIGKVPKPAFPRVPNSGRASEAHIGIRRVYFDELGDFVETNIYSREKLRAGAILVGPCVIEQIDSTTLVPPGMTATVDEYFNIIINTNSK